MYRHLTVALDGSHNAVPALHEAVRLAVAANSRLSLVHVICLHDFAVESVGLLDTQALYDAARQQGQAVLDEAAAYARSQGLGDVALQLLEAPQGADEASSQLVAFAEQAGTDLLVIGTHGHRGWRHLLLGSFAESVLRKTSLPLLVLRNAAADEVAPGAEV